MRYATSTFISNSIFRFSLELLTKIGNTKLKVSKKLLILFIDSGVNCMEFASSIENCLGFPNLSSVNDVW